MGGIDDEGRTKASSNPSVTLSDVETDTASLLGTSANSFGSPLHDLGEGMETTTEGILLDTESIGGDFQSEAQRFVLDPSDYEDGELSYDA